MRKIWELSRRRFLQTLATLGLAPAVKPVTSRAANVNLITIARPGYQSLDPHQVEMLEAVAEQIIPKDQDPGAREAGAVHYIDRVLIGEQRDRRTLYAAGLEGIDQTSQLMFDRNFVNLSFDDQTTVLKAVEKGEAQGEMWRTVSSRDFFSLLWNHVIEGFYGPPEHGGNKDYASWKMVGFPEHSGTM